MALPTCPEIWYSHLFTHPILGQLRSSTRGACTISSAYSRTVPVLAVAPAFPSAMSPSLFPTPCLSTASVPAQIPALVLAFAAATVPILLLLGFKLCSACALAPAQDLAHVPTFASPAEAEAAPVSAFAPVHVPILTLNPISTPQLSLPLPLPLSLQQRRLP